MGRGLDSIYAGDELNPWIVTREVSGSNPDYSSGYTFAVTATSVGSSTYSFSKTTGITGATDGVITVTWTSSDLGSLAAGTYELILTITHVGSSKQDSLSDRITVLAKPSAPA